MSWEYFIVPRLSETPFSEEALAAMRAYWDAYPTYSRSDGVIAICRSPEYRDYVIRSGLKDQPSANIEAVALKPHRVTLGVIGPQNIDAIHQFIQFCQSSWSCDLLDQREHVISPDRFRSEMTLDGHAEPPAE